MTPLKNIKTVTYTRKQISKRGWRKVPKPAECVWDCDDGWTSSCNETFYFEDCGPLENGFKFCPYCGKKLVEK